MHDDDPANRSYDISCYSESDLLRVSGLSRGYYCQGLSAPGNTTLHEYIPDTHRRDPCGYYAFCRVARMCADATCFGAGRSRRVSLTRTCSVLGFSDDNERQHDTFESRFLDQFPLDRQCRMGPQAPRLFAPSGTPLMITQDAPFEPWPRSVDSKTHAA